MNPDTMMQLILDDKDFKLVYLIAGVVNREENTILGDLSFFIMIGLTLGILIGILLLLSIVNKFRAKII